MVLQASLVQAFSSLAAAAASVEFYLSCHLCDLAALQTSYLQPDSLHIAHMKILNIEICTLLMLLYVFVFIDVQHL